jgi:hypothetical protein
MNERNVEALSHLLTSAWYDKHSVTGSSTLTATEMAERLASHGVLVPSALTDEQQDSISDCADSALILVLEGIASGKQ